MSRPRKPLYVVRVRDLHDGSSYELGELNPAPEHIARYRADWFKRCQLELHGNGARLDIDAEVCKL